MHCNGCGCVLETKDQFCPGCGKPVVVAPPIPAAGTVPPPMYVAQGHPSGKATASLICGIFFFIFPLAIGAVVLGHMALAEIKRSAGRLMGEGRAIAGLVLGYVGLAVIPFVLIIAAIAIPNLLRARMAANEASAVGSIRTINSAQIAYAEKYKDRGFACSLDSLSGPAENCSGSEDHACLLDPALASGTKSGYHFRLEGCSGEQGPMTSFAVIANPVQQGASGQRTFCSDQTGVIKTSQTETTVEDCLSTGTPLD